MKNMLFSVLFLLAFLAACSTTQTLNEEGQKFTFKKEQNIIIGKTAKREIFENYGQPNGSSILGKYEILTYSYSKESFKAGGIGSALLSEVPVVGLVQAGVELQRDRGKDDTIREWQNLTVYIELSTGIVRDFYYRDSDLNGHDESETLYLRSIVAFQQKKNDEAVKMLEQAVSLNPNNHRAANSLAWRLIDLGIDIEKGINFAKKAVEVFPDSPYNNGTLGVGYYKKGDYVNAVKYLQTAVTLFPVYAPRDFKALQHDRAMLETAKNMQQK